MIINQIPSAATSRLVSLKLPPCVRPANAHQCRRILDKHHAPLSLARPLRPVRGSTRSTTHSPPAARRSSSWAAAPTPAHSACDRVTLPSRSALPSSSQSALDACSGGRHWSCETLDEFFGLALGRRGRGRGEGACELLVLVLLLLMSL